MKRLLNPLTFVFVVAIMLATACSVKDKGTAPASSGTGALPAKATMILKTNTATVASTAQAIITATCTEETGAFVVGQQIMFSLSDPTMGTISNGGIATTNDAGTAIVTFVPAQGKTGKVTIAAAYENMSGTTDVTIVDTSSLMAISISASPASVTTGAATTITVHVVDGTGNLAPDGTNVTFSLDSGLKGILQSSAQATSGGDATVSFKAGTISTVAVITATVGKVSANVAVAITGGTAADMLVTASTTSITAGQTSVISAMVVDALNKPVSGANVTFSLSDVTKGALSVNSAITDATGVARTTLTGTGSPFVTVIAGCLGYSSSVSVHISGIASSASMFISSTQTSLIVNGSTVITALVLDGSGAPVNGKTVTFASSGGGTLNPASATTDATGVVSVGYTAGGTSGADVITATCANLRVSGTVSLAITTPAPAYVDLTTIPTTSTSVQGTMTIRAYVSTGTPTVNKPVANGTQVTFVMSDSGYGTLSNTIATTYGGLATTTFTAANTPGSLNISAVAGNIMKTIPITIGAVNTGSIQFVSASPQVIGIRGSGQIETSSVTFAVMSVNGMPVADGTIVDFSLIGPNGGEYIGSTPGSTTASGSTVSGNASVILRSGTVAGPVTVIARTTISGGGTITTSAGQISIGGGVPSATHFSLATDKINLPGFVYANKQAAISAYVADRFGNYNVLEGTSISFYTEGGAIDRQGSTTNGAASVNFRTQLPNPAQVALWDAGTKFDENTLISRLNGTYNIVPLLSGVAHPRNGWVTILATVQGEEEFLDENGDGLFTSPTITANAGLTSSCPTGYTCECADATGVYKGYVTAGGTCPVGQKRSEAFKDTGEPFIDVNDDGCWNDSAKKYCDYAAGVASADPFETYIDSNGDKQYNGPNGRWDGPSCQTVSCQQSKMIWTTLRLAFTGHSQYCLASPYTAPPGSVTIKYGESKDFTFMVGDGNTNSLVPGTTISLENITSNCPDVICIPAGTLTGQGTSGNSGSSGIYTITDSLPSGPAEITFNMKAPPLADTDKGGYCTGCAGGSCVCPDITTSIMIKVESEDVQGCNLNIPVLFTP